MPFMLKFAIYQCECGEIFKKKQKDMSKFFKVFSLFLCMKWKVGLLVLVALLAVQVASAATITVCPSGCDYTSIQDAINAASPGDTILVGDGEYAGDIIVNKSVSLIAENRYGAVINGSGGVYSIPPDPTSGAGIIIKANDVLVDGFIIKNIPSGGDGIIISGERNNIILRNLNITAEDFVISIASAPSDTLSNITIENVTAFDTDSPPDQHGWDIGGVDAITNLTLRNIYTETYIFSVRAFNSMANIYVENVTVKSNMSATIGILNAPNITVLNTTFLLEFGEGGDPVEEATGIFCGDNCTIRDSYFEGNGTIIIANRSATIENVTVKTNYPFGSEGTYYGNVEVGDYSLVTRSTIEILNPGNESYGLSLCGHGSVVYLNSFLNWTTPVDPTETTCFSGFSEGSPNNLNSTEEFTYLYGGNVYTSRLGNYYSDYACTDSDNDGICDNPRTFDAENIDYYPLAQLASLYEFGGLEPTPTTTVTTTTTTTTETTPTGALPPEEISTTTTSIPVIIPPAEEGPSLWGFLTSIYGILTIATIITAGFVVWLYSRKAS